MLPLVMCIDDDPMVQMLCEIIFEDNNFCERTVMALDGKLALKYFEEQLKLQEDLREIPQLVFLDINMPVLDGWDFLELFNEQFAVHFPDTKFAVLSSSVNPADRQRAIGHKLVSWFFPKPLDEEQLNDLKSASFFRHFFSN